MIDVDYLVTHFADLLRTIPELLNDEMSGDLARINAYRNRFPDESSLLEAVSDLPSPGILVAHSGTTFSSDGSVNCWRHELAVYVRAKAKDASQPPSYWNIHRLIWKGVPDGQEEALGITEVHPDCYSMEPPSMSRQSDSEGLDYFVIQVAFNEKGDE